MNVANDVRVLKDQVAVQGQAIGWVCSLLARLVAETGDRARVIALLDAEAATQEGQHFKPLLDRARKALDG